MLEEGSRVANGVLGPPDAKGVTQKSPGQARHEPPPGVHGQSGRNSEASSTDRGDVPDASPVVFSSSNVSKSETETSAKRCMQSASALYWYLHSQSAHFSLWAATYSSAACARSPERVSPCLAANESIWSRTRSGKVMFTRLDLPESLDTSTSTSAHTPSA